ncbi:MAG: DEAD/DEAH box helicase [Desulfocapsaceae bacterium]|nr:DEAD/DEAH box helicase [Desulfocapsaceae bacterium]
MTTITVTTDCLLAGAPPALITALKGLLTIDNPQYTAAKRYGRWIGKTLKPKLYYFRETAAGLQFPRGFSNQAVLLCREQTGASPEIIDKRRLLPDTGLTFSGTLRPYQQTAVDLVAKRSFGVLEAGTGSGKTIMALALIARRRQPALIIVHTKELLYQWQDRIAEFLGCEAGLIGDGQNRIGAVTVAIVNSARKRTCELVPQFGHLIVDECHRVPAALFTDVVSNFDCHFLLGLSATAFRNDDGLTKLIYIFMGDRIHKVDQDELKATGAIVRPRLIRKETGFSYAYRGDYQALLKALTRHEGRNRMIVDDIHRAVEDSGTVLVVSDRIGHCALFDRLLKEQGVSVALLTGKTPPEQRTAIVEAVQNGGLQVLVATIQLIGEGFDCPGLSTLFLTTPITFEGRLLQVIGRIMRPGKDKEARVYDYLDDSISVLRRSAQARMRALAGL